MPLFLIAFGGILKRAVSGIAGWLSKRSLTELACIALALCLVVQTFRQMDAAHDRDAWQRNALKCADARKADRRTYAKAQADAADLNRRQVQQIKQKQEAITDAVKTDLTSRLELIRRELRAQSAPIGGAPNRPGAGNPGNAAPGTPGEARMCLSTAERLRAAENEERHDQLITWVERQAKVR